ncbi:LOW QUALITY PROTEIN: reticulophagy regulator 1 [Menidia menidia]
MPGPGLLCWERRPCRTSALFLGAHALLWMAAFGPLRAYSLLAAMLALLVAVATGGAGSQFWHSITASWEVMDSGPESRSEAGPQLSASLRLLLQEASAFKQQNPGKFCLLVCSLCTFFAVLGRYIPGIVLSYILVLAVFLWPLVSSHDVASWLEPVLQKLDFGIGTFLQRIKADHEKRLAQAEAEKEGIESDLSSMFPKLDSGARRDLSVSDTEPSDATWTDPGAFSLSEGHTPQTEDSEDLDREELFSGGLPEFPSLDNGEEDEDEDGEEDLNLGLAAMAPPPPNPPPPPGRRGPPPPEALALIDQMAGAAIAAAVGAAIRERVEGMTMAGGGAGGTMAMAAGGGGGTMAMAAVGGGVDGDGGVRLPEMDSDSDSEAEDFELLDQSELEQLEGELGLGGGGGGGGGGEATPTEAPPTEATPTEATPTDAPPTEATPNNATGFFSKLLRRQ